MLHSLPMIGFISRETTHSVGRKGWPNRATSVGAVSGRGAVAVTVGLRASMDAKAVVAEEVGVRLCGVVNARESVRDCFSINKAR